MYSIGVHREIERMMSIFYFFGIWQRTNCNRFISSCLRIWYSVVYFYVLVALALGSVFTDNQKEMVFMAVTAIVALLIVVRLYFFLWKKDEIVEFIRKLGAHSMGDEEEFRQVNGKLNGLMKFTSFYHIMVAVAISTLIALPFISGEHRLPLSYYFPFDWHGDDILYTFAYVFVVYGLGLTCLFTLFNSVIWYLAMSCGIKYLTLGNEFRTLGGDGDGGNDEGTVADVGHRDRFLLKLMSLIRKHKDLQETTNHFKTFFSNVFLFQIATSGLSICGSTYALAFANPMDNPFQYIVFIVTLAYSVFDIFMITYFGNEIKSASTKLSYCLFECNWIEQSSVCKSCMLILQEVLKKPQVLVIGKLYALDLEVFSNILNFAYSQFNILKNLKFE